MSEESQLEPEGRFVSDTDQSRGVDVETEPSTAEDLSFAPQVESSELDEGETVWAMRWRKLLLIIEPGLDLFFPVAVSADSPGAQRKKDTSRTDRELKAVLRQVRRNGIEEPDSSLRSTLELIDRRLAHETERRKTIDSRLSALMGIVAVSATLVLNAFTESNPAWIQGIALYIIVQAASVSHATIQGMSRMYVDEPDLADEIPRGHDEYELLITKKLKLLEQHRKNNNVRVTRMVIAHTGMRNFILGAVVLALSLVYHSVGSGVPEGLPEHPGQPAPRGPEGPQAHPVPQVPRVHLALKAPKVRLGRRVPKGPWERPHPSTWPGRLQFGTRLHWAHAAVLPTHPGTAPTEPNVY